MKKFQVILFRCNAWFWRLMIRCVEKIEVSRKSVRSASKDFAQGIAALEARMLEYSRLPQFFMRRSIFGGSATYQVAIYTTFNLGLNVAIKRYQNGSTECHLSTRLTEDACCSLLLTAASHTTAGGIIWQDSAYRQNAASNDLAC